MLDDDELAQRFPNGDPEIVRDIYDRYGGAIHTVAMSYLHDRELADDVVQATFLNAWRAASSFDPTRKLAPWLYTIARRQAIDIRRKLRRVETVTTESIEGADEGPELDHVWEAWQVRLAVDELQPDEREVVRLTWFAGLTHGEVAERLGVPVGTVKSRSHRAHGRLAALLGHLAAENRSCPANVVGEEGPVGGETP